MWQNLYDRPQRKRTLAAALQVFPYPPPQLSQGQTPRASSLARVTDEWPSHSPDVPAAWSFSLDLGVRERTRWSGGAELVQIPGCRSSIALQLYREQSASARGNTVWGVERATTRARGVARSLGYVSYEGMSQWLCSLAVDVRRLRV